MKDIQKLIASSSISTLGDSLTFLSVVLLLASLTPNVDALIVLMILNALPRVAFGLLSGSLADAYNQKNILRYTEIINVLLSLLLIVAVVQNSKEGIYLIVFLKACASAIFKPAQAAILPRYADMQDLSRTYSSWQTATTIASVLGTALAALFISITGTYWVGIAVDATTFLLSYLLISQLHYQHEKLDSVAPASLLDHFKAGFNELGTIQKTPVLRTIAITTFAMMFVLGIYNLLYIPFLNSTLKVQPYWYSIVEGIQAGAVVIAGILFTAKYNLFKDKAWALLSSALLGLALVLCGLSQSIATFILALALLGLAEIPLSSSLSALVQRAVSDEIRGRVAATLGALMAISELLALLLVGLLGSNVSVGLMLAVSSLCIFACLPLLAKTNDKVELGDAVKPQGVS
ncbi:MFS transporter [Deinococcus sp. 6YEL10]|uniref:MFS transporter n=1 Tax=Deinococcus sp. 6YEL10 TaxID=2745870 RepID=UPI001E315B5B|nr:MFS transporter [Deinococcus sp. 6YEL10]MCD0163158.1 MFS transporter [Deinococcus sp. 6YEL10]